MRCAVIVFPGSNCDSDLYIAFNQFDGVEVEYVWYTTETLDGFELILLPGGFAYGDYLRAGALAARAPVLKALTQAADQGVRVIGICNGFQVLTECGLLPGALQRNSGLHFICDTPRIEVVQVQSVFSSRYQLGELIRLPIAHGEGNYTCDELTLRHLQAENRIVFRYASGNNPNGSLDNIAGILNPRGNVLGMMPHPERAMADWMGTSDGRRLFESVLNFYPETADAA